jgi:signal transduction histidine kinase/ActR/RegA family two-component response regulator
MTGSIVSYAYHWSAAPLNTQLFSDEIYIAFLSVLFLIFSALAEERRNAFYTVEAHNRELHQALDRLAAEDKAKTDFIAILAHELRNPLAPIVSAHDWLLLREHDQESRMALESAQKHALMIRHLLDDLLDTARLSQRGFTLKKGVVSLHDIMAQSVESTAGFLQSRGHSLRVVRQEHDTLLFADPIRLKQILINLLNNAGKYTEPGGKIILEAQVTDAEVFLRVSDTGIGIEPQLLERIFEPFRRFAPDMNLGTGLGVGLSLTKQLVEMHDGAIVAYSDGLGKGTTLEVRIPRSQEALALPARKEPKRDAPATRILVVDDNVDAASGLQKLLEHYRHTVAVAHAGMQALELAQREQPEVVLLDIGLPDIDGHEVARRLRESGFRGRIVALSGYGQLEDKEESRQSGFDRHLVKPVNIEDVLSLLRHFKQEPEAARP